MGFFDRLRNAWKIFKLSFNLLKKDKSLVFIPVFMMFSSLIFILLFISEQIYSNLITLFLILILFYFWITFLGAAQSWMVYEVLKGKNTNVSSGFKRASNNLWDIIQFVAVMIFIKIISSWLRGKGRIGEYAGRFINYISGIAGKLVLPAMIITERNFKDAVKQLKHSLKIVPEIAAYEIGIRPLTTLAFFIGLFLAFLFGVGFGFIIGIGFLFVYILFIILLSVYVNDTYYTVLYLTLIEKKKIKGLNLFIKK